MDPVTSAQYQLMKDSFGRQGTEIEVAYTPAGGVHHIHAAGRLLAVDRDDNVERLQAALPGLRRAESDQPAAGDLVLLSIEEAQDGSLSVAEALDLIEERLGDDNPALAGEAPLATPVHVVHIARICPAGEPEVPSGYPAGPWPAPRQATGGGHGVRLGISDTGLLELDAARYPWLAGVDGERDPLGPTQAGSLQGIPEYAGHGTFVAGVAKTMAPTAAVYVNDHFTLSGGVLEHVIIAKLEQLIEEQSPDVVSLSAGTYTRNNWAPLAFTEFRRRHSEITLVAAAGNDSTDRQFWPAAFDWTVGVGALGADQQHRAWFSNHGDWVDVYALGEGMVNAYATGLYTYREPPKRPARQTFDGMARWDGTSFSTPLVAGLIADEISRTGSSAAAATQAVLARAREQAIRGVGPAVLTR
jgi:subtilisin family serine protease